MKKIALLFFICAIFQFAKAQQTFDRKAFETNYNLISNQAHAAYKNKDYKRSIEIINNWLLQYDSLAISYQQNYIGDLNNAYYNRACYKAMLGQKEEALADLQLAVDKGYSYYQGTVNDSDLISLHDDNRYKVLLNKIREKGDLGYVLQQAGKYNHEKSAAPKFTYQSAFSPQLVAFRRQYNLDSIAGDGDEISKFKKLLFWAHNIVRHDGNSYNPLSRNAIDLINVCKKENRGVNCRMMSTILRDAYQAEGFKSRIVTCLPKDTLDNDCHVITVVWSKTLNKWVWMDPTFNAYVSDDKGNLLNIEEVRTRLIAGKPLVLNDDANWNNKNKETKQHYLGYYMTKNLYALSCPVKSEWDVETRQVNPKVDYKELYPQGYSRINGSTKRDSKYGITYATNNASDFWQKPSDN